MAIPSLMEGSNTTRAQMPDLSSEAEPLLTVSEVAALLRVPVSWVYERTRRRGQERLPHLKMGKYLRFRSVEIQQYLETLHHD